MVEPSFLMLKYGEAPQFSMASLTPNSRRSHWFTADITSAKRFRDSCNATERSGAGSFLPELPAGTRSTNKERTVELQEGQFRQSLGI